MPWVNQLVIQKGKKKERQNKQPETKRNSKICTKSMRMTVSAGIKKNRLMKIC